MTDLSIIMSWYIEYSELEDSDKYVLDLNSDLLSLRQRFTVLVQFMRWKSSEEGCIIFGIPEARCVNGCPLMEIKVKYKDVSTQFLIAKENLYVVGYSFDGMWFCFKDAQIKVVGCQILGENSKYGTSFSMRFGARAMLNALYDLQVQESSVRKAGCEVFFVHLSEAARFRPIENQIYLALCQTDFVDFDEVPGWEQTALPGFASQNLGQEGDILTLISPEGSTDFKFDVASFEFAIDLVHSWAKLSQGWVYCATGCMDFLEAHLDQTFEQCQVRTVHSLKNTLGVLFGLDYNKMYLKVEASLGGGRENIEKLKKLKNEIDRWEEERKKKELVKKDTFLKRGKGLHIRR